MLLLGWVGPQGMDDIDIFDADGALTAEYLLSRGYCCGQGCRNCPYEPRHGGLDAVPRTLPAEGDTMESS